MTPLRARIGFWGLLEALGFAAAVISLAGFLGAFTWWLEILSHFRVQYALCFARNLALRFASGRMWPARLAPWPWPWSMPCRCCCSVFPRPRPPPAAAPVFRAMLINVNSHLGDPIAVGAVIASTRPDILVLEEISGRWLNQLAPALEIYPYRQTAPRHDNFGIGLFSLHPIESARIVPFGLVDIPSIFAECRIGSRQLAVVATHPMPPGDALLAAERNRHLDWIARAMASQSRPRPAPRRPEHHPLVAGLSAFRPEQRPAKFGPRPFHSPDLALPPPAALDSPRPRAAFAWYRHP
jgi:endonuclease/exonuclease/phosphatase (EEP) superfamily protein YafD